MKSEVQTVCRVLVTPPDYEFRNCGLEHVQVVLSDSVRAEDVSVRTWLDLSARGENLEEKLLSMHTSQRWGASSEQEIVQEGPMAILIHRIEILVRKGRGPLERVAETVRAHLPGCDVSVGRG